MRRSLTALMLPSARATVPRAYAPRVLRWACATLLPLALCACAPTADERPERPERPEPPERPHILIWMVDTLRADHLGCYGYGRPTSPNMDALAAEGVLFEQAHVHTNWTLPSVTSLLTGCYPPVFAADFSVAVPAELVMAQQWFGQHGYQTAGMTITLATAGAFGFSRGFDQYRELDAEASPHARRLRQGPEFDADRVVDAALTWLDDERDAARPFLLYLHTVDPHVPYEAHGEPARDVNAAEPGVTADSDADADAGDASPQHGPDVVDGSTEARRDGLRSGRSFTRRDRQQLLELYDQELAFNDGEFGRLLEGLTQRGLAEDTLVVLVSDHGEEFWDRRAHGHGHRNLHAELTHVPLILRWPAGLPAGARVDGLMLGIDLAPTLVQLAGLPPLPGADGSSVADVARAGGSLAGRGQILFAHRAKQGRDVMAVRSERLLYHLDPQGTTSGLYDLQADPGAMHDLRAEQPERAAGPREALRNWLDSRRLVEGRWQAERDVVIDEQQAEALRAMGYLGDDEH
ncbi:MAG: hypothetical protein DRQ55_04635 [Planctomycetota bacterium]|nr:MAG: hypothetical protein DRQ55_04635 [Planctomycetota bacterium]